MRNPFLHLKKKLMEDFSFTDAEANALMGFKTRNCVPLNKSLRDKSLNATEQQVVVDLDNALKKLPPCGVSIVYRNLKFSPDQLEAALCFFTSRLGKVIQFPDFLSCTKLQEFTGNKKDYEFVMQISLISPTFCREIHLIWQKFGVRDAEQKVAFTRNTCFRITRVDPENYIKLYLQEVTISKNAEEVPVF